MIGVQGQVRTTTKTPETSDGPRHGTLPLVVALAFGASLLAMTDPANAAGKKSKKRADAVAAEPYVMIFSPESTMERPLAVVETRAADVPDAPLLFLTMGSGPTGDGAQDVEPEDVGVAEKAVILDKAEVDAPAGSASPDDEGGKGDDGKQPVKAKKKKKKKAAATP